MTDYINKVDLLLALADLPNEAGKREALRVVYDMPAKHPFDKSQWQSTTLYNPHYQCGDYMISGTVASPKPKKED